ncbi:hypothetical protein HHK36_012228 [Tetracentron sinense]|uniref:3'-5' exonuclease domain-containing protein n=1 Tax=Tetracentron sinense TaxID=13715 RepID=A0A834Z8D5_TETSI|nr:hypothetical protein HHK36_012228 [Tetracentron sinense]
MNGEDISMTDADRRIFFIDFFGNRVTTTVTSTPSVLRKWIRSTWYFRRFYRTRLIVGLGVQWNPDFDSCSDNPAATLQLCVGCHCIIFQLSHANYVPRLLVRFLSDPTTTFVGIWNSSDSDKLFWSRHHLVVKPPLDLRFHAASVMGRTDLENASMEALASEILGWEGLKKDRFISLSRWDAFELSYDQVHYACADAHVSFEIGKKLRAWEDFDF